MKSTITFVLGFALLGALTGAFFALLLGPSFAGNCGLPGWLDNYISPVLMPLVIAVPLGLFIGALTGLASAFSTGPFATVRCLLTITIPAILIMPFFPWEGEKAMEARWLPTWPLWTAPLAGAVVAVAMTVLLVYLGQRRMRMEKVSGTVSRIRAVTGFSS